MTALGLPPTLPSLMSPVLPPLVLECEEALPYLTWLQGTLATSVEEIIEPLSFSSITISYLLPSLLGLRQIVLDRMGQVRMGKVELCPGEEVEQESGLSIFRQEIMKVLLGVGDYYKHAL